MSDRQIARAAAQLAAEDANAGLAQMDLNTGIVFEWLKTPPTPFDQWETHNPEFNQHSAETLTQARFKILNGVSKVSNLAVTLRFPDSDDWLLGEMTITAIGEAHSSDTKTPRNALVQIGECATPPMMW